MGETSPFKAPVFVATTVSVTTLTITTFSITAHSIKGLYATLSMSDTKHK